MSTKRRCAMYYSASARKKQAARKAAAEAAGRSATAVENGQSVPDVQCAVCLKTVSKNATFECTVSKTTFCFSCFADNVEKGNAKMVHDDSVSQSSVRCLCADHMSCGSRFGRREILRKVGSSKAVEIARVEKLLDSLTDYARIAERARLQEMYERDLSTVETGIKAEAEQVVRRELESVRTLRCLAPGCGAARIVDFGDACAAVWCEACHARICGICGKKTGSWTSGPFEGVSAAQMAQLPATVRDNMLHHGHVRSCVTSLMKDASRVNDRMKAWMKDRKPSYYLPKEMNKLASLMIGKAQLDSFISDLASSSKALDTRPTLSQTQQSRSSAGFDLCLAYSRRNSEGFRTLTRTVVSDIALEIEHEVFALVGEDVIDLTNDTDDEDFDPDLGFEYDEDFDPDLGDWLPSIKRTTQPQASFKLPPSTHPLYPFLASTSSLTHHL